MIDTPRLLLRNWTPADLDDFHAVNSNPEVMKHFPATLNREETAATLERFRLRCEEYGYTYFAAELRETGECIGFVGLSPQTFPAEFTPCVDIGWRLKESAWGKGYATEGRWLV